MELDRFYDLVPSNYYAATASVVPRVDYSLFDTDAFQKGFAEKTENESQYVHFYLNDMTCYACVWVCEQVTKKIDSRSSLSINMTTGEASLLLPSGSKPLSEFVKTYESLGYAVTPNRNHKKESRSELNRIGVAFFCLMNVMMLAFPEYLDIASLSETFRNVFRYVSAALAGLTVFYSGWPFLKNALGSVRNRQVHLDFPIGLALIVGYFYSVWNTFQAGEHVYFDSMTAVVTLVLTGRFIQSRALSTLLREQSKFMEGGSDFVRLEKETSLEMVPLPTIQKGQTLHLLPGEVIPLKSVLRSTSAEISYGLLRGESRPHVVRQGDEIFAGAVNGSSAIEVDALEEGSESFLLQLQSASRKLYQDKGRFLSLSERFARFFVGFVLAAAFGIALYFMGTDPEEGFRRFAAVLLVACPCIFGFGAPLVIAKAFQIGLQRGVVFRSQLSLENLSTSKTFYFDKTGTLTKDELKIVNVHWHDENMKSLGLERAELILVLQALSRVSRHHVPRALAQWSKSQGEALTPVTLSHVEETFGQGLSFVWNTNTYKLGRNTFCFGHDCKQTFGTYLSVNDKEIFVCEMDEALREEARDCLTTISANGSKEIYVLSGDQKNRVESYRKALGIPSLKLLGDLSPPEKLGYIKRSDRSVMVGNGINDTLASSGASIGVALANATDAMKEASDIVLQREGLKPLLEAMEVSAEARRVMTRCFVLALSFNAVAMSLALSGIVTPVMAAILMPASSITVFFSSQRFRLRRQN